MEIPTYIVDLKSPPRLVQAYLSYMHQMGLLFRTEDELRVWDPLVIHFKLPDNRTADIAALTVKEMAPTIYGLQLPDNDATQSLLDLAQSWARKLGEIEDETDQEMFPTVGPQQLDDAAVMDEITAPDFASSIPELTPTAEVLERSMDRLERWLGQQDMETTAELALKPAVAPVASREPTDRVTRRRDAKEGDFGFDSFQLTPEAVRELSPNQRHKLALSGGPSERSSLLEYPDCHVWMLRNPDLTADEASQIAAGTDIHPDTVRFLVDSQHWCSQEDVVAGLLLNRRVHQDHAALLIDRLPTNKLEAILALEVPAAVAMAIRVRLRRKAKLDRVGTTDPALTTSRRKVRWTFPD